MKRMKAFNAATRLSVLALLAAMSAGASLAQQSPHGEIDIACADCHTTDSWKMSAAAAFDHASTGFTLAGQHRFLECGSCHAGLRFEGTKRECLTCHTDVHNAELGSECMRCHTLSAWVVSDMRQKHQETRFPLAGRHLSAECESCHDDATPRRYASTSPECISCHREEYSVTMEPSHTVAGFSVDCAGCHKVTSAAWKGSFDHNLTAFPLTGAHQALICSECHVGNTFGKLPTDCVSCHDDEYRAALLPNHVTAGFSTACLSCHTTIAWSPAAFDHNATRFPLTGRHVPTPCGDCHVNGNYQLTYTDCYQCHQPEYASVTDPNHVVANFGHDCAPCHTTTAWSPSTFNHDARYFRIYSGKHAGEWPSCSTCHDAPSDYTVYTCIPCHVHNEQETAGHHDNVTNYLYTRTSCYTCHRDA